MERGMCEVETSKTRDEETNESAFAKGHYEDKVRDFAGSMVWIRLARFPVFYGSAV